MFDRLIDYFLGEPQRLVSFGRGLVSAGGLNLLLAEIGHLATSTVGIVLGHEKNPLVEQSLANAFPGWPTWWVPETVVGCVPAILLIIAGVTLARLGERLVRQYF